MKTTETYEPFKKTIRFDSKSASARINIEFSKDGRLSISGSVRELGRYGGSTSGQCQDEMLKQFPESKRLFEIWEAWHLNDMRAGCEHQRKDWDPSEKVTVSTYKLTTEAWELQRSIKSNAEEVLEAGESFKYTPEDLAIIKMPWTLHDGNHPDVVRGYYELDKEEVKIATWVRPEENPRGILDKACATCGYKFGSAWLFEEVPTDILAELREMK